MWLVGEVLSLLERVEMGSLGSMPLFCGSTEVSVSFKHLQQSTPGFVLICFFMQNFMQTLNFMQCLLNTCCYIDMPDPLPHPLKAQNPLGWCENL